LASYSFAFYADLRSPGGWPLIGRHTGRLQLGFRLGFAGAIQNAVTRSAVGQARMTMIAVSSEW
jgi:hypothetical protein